MTYLFILDETFTNNFSENIINLISLLSVLCGILVIVSKNPIVSVLFLIGLFLNIAGYLMMLGVNFIGLSYLLVYVGAVSILFLFILMLINVRVSELSNENYNSIPLAIFIGTLFYLNFHRMLPTSQTYESLPYSVSDSGTSTYFIPKVNLNIFHNEYLSYVTSQTWDGALSETSHITTIGNVIYTTYPIWLILTSIILLLAMVGAIVITIKQKEV